VIVHLARGRWRRRSVNHGCCRLVVRLMELNTRKRNKVMSYLNDMVLVIEEREKKDE